jgi:alanine dehydrogenase
VYSVDGVIHYCVSNMPGAVPATATRALVNATLPFVLAFAECAGQPIDLDGCSVPPSTSSTGRS